VQGLWTYCFTKKGILLFGACLLISGLWGQGNKLSIQGKGPKNMSICGFDDTANITVYNISGSVISGIKVTLTLPTGINYVKGTVTGSGVAESNVSNLNKPIFSASNLLLGQNFTFRLKLTANCDLVALLSGSYTPDIGIRADYTGNFDVGTSSPFVPLIPSPGFASITNLSFTGNIGDVFVRKISITNYSKGPLSSLRLMTINGSDLKETAQKGFTRVVNGDTVWTYFNTTDIKKVGDNDTLFEQNETLIITDTFTINGCNSLNSYFEIAWGCGGKLCQKIKNNGSATISADNPFLKTWASSNNKLCFTGNTPNQQLLYVTNIGKKDAKSTQFTIFTPYGASNCRMDTTSIWVKKGYKGTPFRVYADSCKQLYYVVSCMPSNAITYMQLRLPNIAPKDTIFISWDMFRCASDACGFTFNDISWMYTYEYKNQCKSLSAVGNAWGLYYGAGWGTISTLIPTDLQRDETKDFRFTFTQFYNVPMDKTGKIRIDFILPKTLTHNLNKSDFFIVNYNQTSTWYPDSIVWRKDTLRAFMGSNFAFGLANAELTVRLKGICSVYNGNASLPVAMSLYYNPFPACNPYLWIRPICITFNTKVHCSNACNGGLRFQNFELYRSSYGLPDADNDGLPDKTGALDFSKIRRERAMYGDTITSVFVGRPKPATGINSWRYAYAESFVTYGAYLDVLDAKLVSMKGASSTVVTGNCNTVRVKKVVSGGNATFSFDFTVDSIYPKGCLSSIYRYTVNDSLRLVVRYKVASNISAQGVLANFTNRFYFGSAANPTPSQTYQCDTFSGNMMIYGNYLYNCCGDNVIYSNCAEVALSQSWYNALGAWSYAGNNLFPYEYRTWMKIKALHVYLPNTLKLKSTTWFGQYRTTGTSNYLLEQNNNLQPKAGSTNPLVYDFSKSYKDSGGPFNVSDDGVQGYFYYTVQPKCNMPTNTPIRIDYDYIFERQGVWGKGYDTISTKKLGGADYFTFIPPTLKLTPQISTVYASKDTVDWIVSYSNPSATFSAYNVWLSPRSNANIKVVEVRDYDKDTVIKAKSDLYQAGVLMSGVIRRFKIRAVYNSCSPDSLVVFGSYDCADYPSDFASYPCNANRTTLFLEPQNTRLDLTLTDSISKTSLCATNRMTLLVENIQSVTVYGTKIRVSLPIGMKVVNNSAILKYPLSSAAINIGQPVLVSGTNYEWDLATLSTNISKGFVGTSDTSKNKLSIIFRVQTDCDYASGSFISARAISNIKCGDAVPASPAYSNPLDILGVTRPYYTIMKTWADSMLPCEKSMIFKARVIFLGPGKSGSKDRVEVFLPKGMNRDTSYFVNVRNAPKKDSLVVTDINGATLLSWSLPKNIAPGDSLEFDIKVNGYGQNLNCGAIDVLARCVVIQPVICVTTGTSCDIKVITGSELAIPIVDKGSLAIVSTTITSKLISSDSEEVYLTSVIKNNGKYMNGADPLIVRYHYDANNNGKWDKTDNLIATDTLKKTFPMGTTANFVKKIRVKTGQSCAILEVIDSAACSCKFGQRRFGVPRILNAGNDTAICSGSKLGLGTYAVKNFYYFWDNFQVLDDRLLGKPSFTATNYKTVADTVNLILTTNRGFCTTKDSVTVIVNPLPNVKITISDTQVCVKSKVFVVGKISGGAGSYSSLWSPTAGVNPSTSASAIIIPPGNSVYTLTATDKKGCKSKDSIRIKVFPFPKAGFSWPIVCQGADPIVTDTSKITSGKIATTEWKYASVDTFNNKTLKVNMAGNSFQKVTLIATSDIGCIDTFSRFVDVKANPAANFKVKYACKGDSSFFKQLSTVDSGNFSKFIWDFGDGNISTVKAPVHKYTGISNFNVTLAAETNWGCKDTISQLAVIFPKPKAAFSILDICERDTLRFVNQTNLFSDTLLSYNWKMGTLGTSTLTNPIKYVGLFGSYSAKLVVNSIHGCVDSTQNTLKVFAVPSANFTDTNICLGFSSTFNNSSKIAQGNIALYRWNFGDGGSSTASNPSWTYKSAGTWFVKVIVESDQGCKDSLVQSNIVFPLARPSFVAVDHCFGEQVAISSKIWGGGVPNSLKWYLGNGDSMSVPSFNYKYKSVGIYPIHFIITTDKGCVRDTLANVEVNQLPVVSASAVNPCNDDSAVFIGSATVSKGFVSSNNWVFSDGSASVQRKFGKRFFPAGIIRGTFYAITDKFCKDSAKSNSNIQIPVTANFRVKDVCLDEVSLFEDKSFSVEPVSKYTWTFGDGKGSSLQNPTYTYKKSGSWPIQLQIETKPGCIYTANGVAVLNVKPVPAFTVFPNIGTVVNPNIAINDISSGADTMWYRTTDGFFTNQRNFVHSFPDSGSFKIWQFTANRFGCKDSAVESVVINFMYTLHVPTAFTPNLDGKNETFGPGGLGIANYEMRIYNRWGALVYVTETSLPWDGTYMGETVMAGAYSVLISIRDYKTKPHYYRGTVQVLR